ncbi:hypothetical protein ACULNC_14185 [Shigella flexneri]
MEFGARVITASDSSGTVVDESGFTKEKLARLIENQSQPRWSSGRLRQRIWSGLSRRPTAVVCTG